MNRYAYVLNNPASMVDPSGLFTLPTGPCDPDVSDCDTDPGPDPGDPCAGFFGCGWPWLPPIPPVNPGQPFVFKVYTGRQIPNFALQRTLLLSIPFDMFAGVVAPSNCMVVNGTTVCKSPIDKLNPMEGGKTNYRDSLPICSAHATVNNSTGVTQTHTDLFNPQGSIPFIAPGVPSIPLLPFHLLFDALPDLIFNTTGNYFLPAGRNLCQ